MVFRWQGITPASPAIAQHCEMLTNAPECRSQPRPVVTTACCQVRVLGPALAGPGSLPSPWRGVSGAPVFLRPSPWLGLVNRAKHSCGKERGRAQKRSRSPGYSPGGARASMGAALTLPPPARGSPHLLGAQRPASQGSSPKGSCWMFLLMLTFEGVRIAVSQHASSKPGADSGVFQFLCSFPMLAPLSSFMQVTWCSNVSSLW